MTAEIMPQRRAMMILSMKIASMLIIDVRRTDYEGGAIRGSLNVPAQGFYWNRVFTCGSSAGRGPRCAGWFLDHVRNTAQDNDMQIMVLESGVKGWVKAGPQYTQFMDGFRPEYWEQLFAEEEKTKQTKADTDASGTGGDLSAGAVAETKAT
ncbi:hypothetical protein LTR29_000952 [Friedmanniomyces endolithicus]|nr:hypothetical protein LTR29_000952 [Friedmanniomyces endolithicus]